MATFLMKLNTKKINIRLWEINILSEKFTLTDDAGLPTFQNAKEEYFEEFLPKKRNAYASTLQI